MRLRNVKNKEMIMDEADSLIRDPFPYRGNWKDYFQNDHPIYVEIGMGKGKFIIENAIKYPEINFIGIEKYDSVIVKAIQKLDCKLDNLVFVRADALLIDEIFDHEVSGIYLNFSDPWPKNRHHLRRLSSSLFLEKYESIFAKQKRIEMRTDNRLLFQYSLVSFSEAGYILDKVYLDYHQDDMPLITTEYEDKFSANGMPIYYVSCSKDCQ